MDVLRVILKSDEPLTSTIVEKKVYELRKDEKLPMLGIAPSNIRRQLLRLRDLFLVEKVKNYYRKREGQSLSDIFDEHIERYFLHSILTRVKQQLKAADKKFK